MTEQPYAPSNPTNQASFAIPLDQVYPTPPPEQFDPYGQVYPQPYQVPFQQPYQQQTPYQQSYQYPYQLPNYQIPIQPATPSSQGGQYSPDQQQFFQPQPYYPPGQQWPSRGYQIPEPTFTNNYHTYLVLSILSIIICGGVFAIPALVYANKMNTAFKFGNKEEYLKAKKLSLTWLIVAVCLGIVFSILFLSLSLLEFKVDQGNGISTVEQTEFGGTSLSGMICNYA